MGPPEELHEWPSPSGIPHAQFAGYPAQRKPGSVLDVGPLVLGVPSVLRCPTRNLLQNLSLIPDPRIAKCSAARCQLLNIAKTHDTLCGSKGSEGSAHLAEAR